MEMIFLARKDWSRVYSNEICLDKLSIRSHIRRLSGCCLHKSMGAEGVAFRPS